ncbi:MFS transporter [Hafnia paralvei]|uniref:MFS transporter n=1 Tax=Hafnia paralvei TaxID=546367 RepID=UPI001D0F2C72|nr:MFS transporter [Hafnia paralvei]
MNEYQPYDSTFLLEKGHYPFPICPNHFAVWLFDRAVRHYLVYHTDHILWADDHPIHPMWFFATAHHLSVCWRVVDRYNRKYVSMISDAVIAVVTLLLAISFILGYKPLWLIFAVLAVRSFGTGIQTPTVNSIIPQLVPKEHLIRVNGINSTLSSLNMLIAPATSGVLYAYLSIEKIFFVDVITAAIALTLMSMLKLARLSSQNLEGKSTIKAIREGFYYLKENPLLAI